MLENLSGGTNAKVKWNSCMQCIAYLCGAKHTVDCFDALTSKFAHTFLTWHVLLLWCQEASIIYIYHTSPVIMHVFLVVVHAGHYQSLLAALRIAVSQLCIVCSYNMHSGLNRSFVVLFYTTNNCIKFLRFSWMTSHKQIRYVISLSPGDRNLWHCSEHYKRLSVKSSALCDWLSNLLLVWTRHAT